jgi:hypothetical protein
MLCLFSDVEFAVFEFLWGSFKVMDGFPASGAFSIIFCLFTGDRCGVEGGVANTE